MHRRKPISAKQRKAELQQKRAVKRGDISPPPPPSKKKHGRKQNTQRALPPGTSSHHAATVASARRLQSAFVKLPPVFLEHTKSLAATLTLERPIPPQAALLLDPADVIDPPQTDFPNTSHDPHSDPSAASVHTTSLSCPKRPKWRYDMTKEMVEKNEEGLFKKWLDHTDQAVDAWCEQHNARLSTKHSDNDIPDEEAMAMPHAPPSFERNLEVWRQLYVSSRFRNIIIYLTRCLYISVPIKLFQTNSKIDGE